MDKQTFTLWPDSDGTPLKNLIAAIYNSNTEKAWDVTIELHRKKKTSSQRNWFHNLCEMWGDAIGLTKGQCKEIVKGHYLGWKHVKVAGIEFPIADGSSEDLDKIGYAKLTDTLYQLAAEMGIYLPSPDPSKKRRS